MNNNVKLMTGAALAICASVIVSQAQIITNGSFENGFNGWNVSGAADVVDYNSSDGTNSARFNSADAPPNAVLAQTFPTMSGERYALQFVFGSWASGGAAAAEQRLSVQVTSGGIRLSNVVTEVSTPGPVNMVTNRVYFWAGDTNSTLTFRDVSLQTVSTDGHLDNVSVEWVGPALSIRVSQVELCWYSQTNRNWQVQYRSTLTTNTWTDLGAPIPGNSPTTCTYDAVAPGTPQRFYQILLVP